MPFSLGPSHVPEASSEAACAHTVREQLSRVRQQGAGVCERSSRLGMRSELVHPRLLPWENKEKMVNLIGVPGKVPSERGQHAGRGLSSGREVVIMTFQACSSKFGADGEC